MAIVRNILVGAAAVALVGSPAFAQQDVKGMITRIDRINGTVTIQDAQNGGSAPDAGSVPKQFKAQGGVSLDGVHAGDRVNVSTGKTGEMTSITKVREP